MSLPILTRITSRVVDERFLDHRRRSTSLAGIVGGVLAALMFAWRFYVDHVWSWDLFTVMAAIVCVKMAAVIWFRLRD